MKVNFMCRTIVLTKKEMRKASNPNSREFKELLELTCKLPAYSIQLQSVCRSSNANRRLTYEAMIQRIKQDAPELLSDFQILRAAAGYPTVSKWFRYHFPTELTMVCFRTNPEKAA
jgi:hypothetical protein